MSAITSVPEVGQVVRVRERHYHVTEVAASTLPRTIERQASHHLVSLTSVEDDGLGEEIEVIWELEPGAEAQEVRRLPRGRDADPPEVFDAFLDAVRWGAISSADRRRLQAPFRSGIAIEDYQLEPLARAIEMPRVNLLIADDVGLGKTIEAGLVALELVLRHRAHRILIVCPATLTVQWQEQMEQKFGLRFEIMNREYVSQQRRTRGIHANPWLTHPRLIVSIDFLKQARVSSRLKETFPNDPYPRQIDLLIVDEAANVAPSGRGKYARESDRTKVIRDISPQCEHRLFLTATPHNGYRESFTALLELVDDQRFARGVTWDPRQLERVMIRRMKRDIVDRSLGVPKFKPRQVNTIEVDFGGDERRAHALLKQYSVSRKKQIEGDARRELLLNFVMTLLKKRLFSSPLAFATTLDRHYASIETPRFKTRIEAKQEILKERLLRLERDVPEGDEYDEALEDSLDTAHQSLRPLTAEQRTLLHELRVGADQRRHRADAKATRLLEWLKQEIRPGGVWSDRRVIIFTEYRDTLKYLRDQLDRHQFNGSRIEVLDGSTIEEDRERIKKQFLADPKLTPVRILLATDAVSEGLDLQLHCSRLIHYEIPWNPNRLEQRNGRIDRHGQRDVPQVFHFVPQGFGKQSLFEIEKRSDLDADLEFLALAVEKVQSIREDLGSYGEVIAEQVNRAMLGERATLDVELDPERKLRAEAASAAVRISQNLRERTQWLHDQVVETQNELLLRPERVLRAVSTALELFHQPPLTEVTLSDGLIAYQPGQLTEAWARTLRGMEHPVTLEPRPLTFESEDIEGRDDLVLAHLQHPLVERSLEFLRREIWASTDSEVLNRVTVRLADDHKLRDLVIVAHGRIVVAGADGKRLHEAIITVGCDLRGGRLSRRNVGETERAQDAALELPAPAIVARQLLDRWLDDRERVEAMLEQRLTEVQNSIRQDLDQQLQREKSEIRSRLNELAIQIDKELEKARSNRQLSLFNAEEDQEHNRDLAAIEQRRQRIPADIELEVAALEKRFETRSPHLFPVAVEFIVPRNIARELERR
ncbi:MAG: DISARM system SNF2-like helicase DrmD [Thermomicrobiales bacterium]